MHIRCRRAAATGPRGRNSIDAASDPANREVKGKPGRSLRKLEVRRGGGDGDNKWQLQEQNAKSMILNRIENASLVQMQTKRLMPSGCSLSLSR